jgi:8-oxo-dGTP diphosphatase
MPRLPDGRDLLRLSVQPRARTEGPQLTPSIVTVVAAVIEEGDRLLVTRRLAGSHLEGCWEFPGGKVAPGETQAESLVREIREELGCGSEVDEEVFSTEHAYPSRVVRLHFFRVRLIGEPRPMLGQEMRWVPRTGLASLEFPPADKALIARLTASE